MAVDSRTGKPQRQLMLLATSPSSPGISRDTYLGSRVHRLGKYVCKSSIVDAALTVVKIITASTKTLQPPMC